MNFARIADLDWDVIKDPYRRIKFISAACISVLVVVALLLTWWLTRLDEEDVSAPAKTEISSEKGETEATIKPQIVNEQPQQQPAKKSKRKKQYNKGKSVTTKDIVNKEVNENSPIVY